MEETSEKRKLQILAAAMELDRSALLIDAAQVAFEKSASSDKVNFEAFTEFQNLDYASQIVKCVSNFLEVISAGNEHDSPDLVPRDVALRILSGCTAN